MKVFTAKGFINVITKEFVIDKAFLKKDITSLENKEKATWFFKTFFDEEQKEITQK